MKIHQTITPCIEDIRSVKAAGKRIGFVPTMGYLHEGHLSLVRQLRGQCDALVVSIFVNPLQFNDPLDFEKYPIDLDRDFKLLAGEGVDIVFSPKQQEIYPARNQSRVTVTELAKPLEGAFRPGHFEGVTTVVSILFNIIQPDVAIFGEKDFQQLRIIEQLVQDMHLPVAVERGALVRETDGLALSSRNVRLSSQGRRDALVLSRALHAVHDAVRQGVCAVSDLAPIAHREFSAVPSAKLEYFEITGERDLLPVAAVSASVPCRALVAAYVEGVRLIDNVALSGEII